MSRIKNPRLALAGALFSAGSLLAMSILPISETFAADPPHLVAYGPSGTLSIGATAAITGDVVGATGTPVYQFRVGNQIVQRYSTNSHFVMKNLKPGQYTITVRSLGIAQERRGQWNAFRSAEVHFGVGSPSLTAQGPANGVATNGTATITAQVVDALATPYFQFVVNGKVVQAYSTNSSLTLKSLKPGSYQVLVESLGPAQYHQGDFSAARQKALTFTVPTPAVSPTLTVQGPANGVATNGTATITAQVVDAVATPYFQFVVNGTIAQAFSTKSSLSLTHLKPGSYQVLVESLGPAQYRVGDLAAARQKTLTFTVPTPAAVPSLAVANASVATGVADTITASGVPSSATVTWSVISSNASTGLVSGTGDTATFVGTAAGTYTVEASVDGTTATAKVIVYGQASAVSLSPASSTVIADGESSDTITANVVDANGNPVGNFDGTFDLNTVSGVTYSQNGTTLTPVNGEVSITVTNGTATFDVGQVAVPGISIAMTPSDLTSTNGQTMAPAPTYSTTTITSAPQVATSLKIVDAPTYLDANTQGTTTSPIAVVAEDQAGYPMLSGTDSITVNVSGAASLVDGTNGQLTLAYNGSSTPAGSTNMSAAFEVSSEQGVTGPITVTATSPGLTSATDTIQAVVAGVPAQMQATLSANSFQEGSAGITLNLQAEDAGGAPVNYTSPVSVIVTKSGTTTAASNILVNGQADSSSTEISLTSSPTAVTLTDSGHGANAGTYTVTIAPVSGAEYSFPAQTLTFTETAGPLSGAAFTSPNTTVTVPVTNPTEQYTLQLEDSYGNPISEGGVKVEIYAVGSTTTNESFGQATVNGTVTSSSTPVTVTTNSSGQATVTLAAEGYQGASWVLYATVPEQPGVNAALQTAPSAAMEVSAQVASSLTIGLQDETAGPDFQSSGYAQAGNTVDATVTLNTQYGGPLNGTQTVQLTIPAGLSGMQPSGSNDSAGWTQGASNTITMSLNLNGSGQATIPLEAWTEGSATLQASVPGVSTSVSGQASIFVQAGTATGVGLFSNGTLINGSNKLTVSANTPVALTVESTDMAGNPVPSSGNQVIALSDQNGGSFRLTETGAPISTVTIPAGETEVTVYYVNGTAGSYVPTASLDAYRLAVVGPSSYTVSPGASQAITAMVYDGSGNAVAGQTVTASVPNSEGTVTPSSVSGSNGAVSFNYTAPDSGSGTAMITLTVPGVGPSGSTLTQQVQINY
ncbi:MAG: hypothetical protein M1600_14365 [Firmicutes bacterium]|nr:hypothetical protein [Bacillota bacterium]